MLYCDIPWNLVRFICNGSCFFLKNSQSQTTENSGVDEPLFRNRMQQPDIVSELFLPMGHATWENGHFSLKKEKEVMAQAETKISGVRFQAADPSGENQEAERQCQQDVLNLIQSLIQLRKTSAFSNIVLSEDILKNKNSQSVSQLGTRVKFGLYVEPKFAHETHAAAECHRNIVQAVRKSGFVVDSPKTFEPKTGMAGLSQWANELQLHRRKMPLWLLLLPLFLLLLFLLRDCSPPSLFVPIETQSFIILMDKSSSMEAHFPMVQEEARKTLESMKSSFFSTHYANVIAYHASATTALGEIKEINNETAQQLIQFLDNLKAGGGTHLRSGIQLAAKEVAAHQKPTTLIILTDGQDASLDQILQERNAILKQFKGVDIIVHTLTPRVFDVENPKPINNIESKLNELAKAFNGQFGEVK